MDNKQKITKFFIYTLSQVVYLSKMARNAIESDFWSSKMANLLRKKKKLHIDLKWREM